jgi:hypothetical protein
VEAAVKKTFVRTYAAFAVLAVLGAYAYFVESKKPPKSETQKEKVFSLDKTKVKALTLAPSGSETVKLVKDGGAWRMTEPTVVAADSSAVESILSSLETLEMAQVAVEQATNLADFGLAEPKLKLTVEREGTAGSLELLLGGPTPDSGSLFAKTPDKPRVFTIASYLESSLNKKPFDLRDRDVLHVKRDAVRSLEVTGPEGSYALARNEKQEWSFTKPLATRAGRWSVDGLLGTLENLRMESVATEDAKDLKAYGLDKPGRTVILGLSDGSSRRLEIGSAAGEKKLHVREASKAMVAVIPDTLATDLAKGMNELRAKRILEFATYDVEGIDAEVEGTKRAYSRSTTKNKDGIDENKWKRTAPDAKDLETSKVEDALFKMGGIDATEFVDKPEAMSSYGLDKPALKVTLRSTGGKPPETVELGRAGGSAFARRTGDESLLKLDATKADELIKAFKEL